MKLEISSEVIEKTKKCRHNFACLAESGEKKLCSILSHPCHRNPQKNLDNTECCYNTYFGYCRICTCPTRVEIFRQYNI